MAQRVGLARQLAAGSQRPLVPGSRVTTTPSGSVTTSVRSAGAVTSPAGSAGLAAVPRCGRCGGLRSRGPHRGTRSMRSRRAVRRRAGRWIEDVHRLVLDVPRALQKRSSSSHDAASGARAKGLACAFGVRLSALLHASARVDGCGGSRRCRRPCRAPGRARRRSGSAPAGRAAARRARCARPRARPTAPVSCRWRRLARRELEHEAHEGAHVGEGRSPASA